MMTHPLTLHRHVVSSLSLSLLASKGSAASSISSVSHSARNPRADLLSSGKLCLQSADVGRSSWGHPPRQHQHNPAILASVCAVADGRSWGGEVPGVSESAVGRPGEKYFTSDTRPVVLYDGVCNFCNAGVNFVLDNDKSGKLRMAALQSEAGRALLQRSGRARDDISSIVLVEKDKSYIKSEAVLRIGQVLDIPLAALAPLAVLTPKLVSDSLYNVVASNRYNILGKRDECRLDDGTFRDRFLAD